MDTSRVDGVKAPQHRGTPRSYLLVHRELVGVDLPKQLKSALVEGRHPGLARIVDEGAGHDVAPLALGARRIALLAPARIIKIGKETTPGVVRWPRVHPRQ